MKVKVIKRFNDLKEKKIQETGTVLEVDETRMKWLVSQGMVEEYIEPVAAAGQQETAKETMKEVKGTKARKGEEA